MSDPVPVLRPTLATVGLVVHSGRPEAREAAADAAHRFASVGTHVVGLGTDLWTDSLAEVRDEETFAVALDLVVVFGGDGTFLRAAHLVRHQGVPLLGVNLGRVGFLAEIELAELPSMVDRVTRGHFDVEERMALVVRVEDGAGDVVGVSWALNEASVERTVPQRLVVVEVRIGQRVFANLPADAVICATPTGSTAYAFSARGPILSPLVDAIVMVPVAPHSLFDRTVVIDPDETLSLRPTGSDNTCVVTSDGRESLVVPPGGSVRIERAETPVRMARLGAFDFYGRVREKFGLP